MEWLRRHWDLPGPTAFCALPGMEELHQAPALFKRLGYEWFIQNRYLQATNIKMAIKNLENIL
jgi:hypothetical protein